MNPPPPPPAAEREQPPGPPDRTRSRHRRTPSTSSVCAAPEIRRRRTPRVSCSATRAGCCGRRSWRSWWQVTGCWTPRRRRRARCGWVRRRDGAAGDRGDRAAVRRCPAGGGAGGGAPEVSAAGLGDRAVDVALTWPPVAGLRVLWSEPRMAVLPRGTTAPSRSSSGPGWRPLICDPATRAEPVGGRGKRRAGAAIRRRAGQPGRHLRRSRLRAHSRTKYPRTTPTLILGSAIVCSSRRAVGRVAWVYRPWTRPPPANGLAMSLQGNDHLPGTDHRSSDDQKVKINGRCRIRIP